MAGTSYMGKGRNIDKIVSAASGTKKKAAKKKTKAKKASEPVYKLNPKTGRYVQVK